MSEKVYILLGPEKGLKEDFIKKIKDSLGDCEVIKFYAFEDYEEKLFQQLNNFDLFGNQKLIILDEAQEINTKSKAQSIADYIKNPSDNVTLLILSTELYINPEIMGAIPNQSEGIIKFYEMFESKKNDWIVAFFRRNNFGIESLACNAIIEKVENNIQEFENVCSQMVTYYRGIPNKTIITCDDVEDFLVHTKEETEFSLFGYIAKGKLESALECLQTIIHTGESSGVAATLASRLSLYFRKTLAIERNLQEGMDIDTALKTRTLDLERAVSMPKDKDIYKSAVSRYKMQDVKRILISLARYDIQVKEVGTLMQQTVLEKCISDIIVHKGSRGSKLEFATLKQRSI